MVATDTREDVLGFEIALSNLGTAFGGSALADRITGFAAKKLAKIVLAIVGIQLALSTYLDYQGVLSVLDSSADSSSDSRKPELSNEPIQSSCHTSPENYDKPLGLEPDFSAITSLLSVSCHS